jgi:hypothetical protein
VSRWRPPLSTEPLTGKNHQKGHPADRSSAYERGRKLLRTMSRALVRGACMSDLAMSIPAASKGVPRRCFSYRQSSTRARWQMS